MNGQLLEEEKRFKYLENGFITSFCRYLPHYQLGMALIVSQIVLVLVNRESSDEFLN